MPKGMKLRERSADKRVLSLRSKRIVDTDNVISWITGEKRPGQRAAPTDNNTNTSWLISFAFGEPTNSPFERRVRGALAFGDAVQAARFKSPRSIRMTKPMERE
jgi:hypothetical protein